MSAPFPVAPCPKCGFGLPAGAVACPRCGLQFSGPVGQAPIAPPGPAGSVPAPGIAAAASPAAGSKKFPAAAVVVIVLVAALGLGAAAFFIAGDGALGDCVLRYQYTGIQRHEGWTQGECNQWCVDNVEPNGRALECWFEPY